MINEDFSYDLKNDDVTISFIRNKENFFGYEKSEPTLFPNSFYDLALEIISDDKIVSNYEYSKIGRDSKYVKRSKRIWNELGINLLKIQYISPSLDFDVNKFDGRITKEFYDKLIYDYPTKIPIKYTDNFLDVSVNGVFLEFEKYNSILFKEIYLPKLEKKINSCIYAHEITHVEQDNACGGVNKITNMETLPIFIELLFGNKIEENGIVTEQIIKHRLVFLASAITELIKNKEMNFERRIKLETYLISIIQAIDLFNKYKNSNEKNKKEFINYINKIFNGEKHVEQMLDNFDSNYSNVEPKLKVLKR